MTMTKKKPPKHPDPAAVVDDSLLEQYLTVDQAAWAALAVPFSSAGGVAVQVSKSSTSS